MSPEDWRGISVQRKVCAVVSCQNKPTNQCPTCLVHYCYEHVKGHFHTVTDEELDRQSRNDENLR